MMLYLLLKFIEYLVLHPLLLALRLLLLLPLHGRDITLPARSSLADGALHGLIHHGLLLL